MKIKSQLPNFDIPFEVGALLDTARAMFRCLLEETDLQLTSATNGDNTLPPRDLVIDGWNDEWSEVVFYGGSLKQLLSEYFESVRASEDPEDIVRLRAIGEHALFLADQLRHIAPPAIEVEARCAAATVVPLTGRRKLRPASVRTRAQVQVPLTLLCLGTDPNGGR